MFCLYMSLYDIHRVSTSYSCLYSLLEGGSHLLLPVLQLKSTVEEEVLSDPLRVDLVACHTLQQLAPLGRRAISDVTRAVQRHLGESHYLQLFLRKSFSCISSTWEVILGLLKCLIERHVGISNTVAKTLHVIPFRSF